MDANATEQVYLAPAEYIDSDHAAVASLAADLARGSRTSAETARRVFYHVRDLVYGPPDFDRLDAFKASVMLAEERGYCVPKAAAFAALCRAAGVPARIGFADVSNHLASPGTLALMGGRVFAWHGYAEVLIEGRWLKVSPTFDAPMCHRLGATPLDFDGRSDGHLQPFDTKGRAFMRYDRWHGTFHDVPARFLAAEMPRRYPRAYEAIRRGAVT